MGNRRPDWPLTDGRHNSNSSRWKVIDGLVATTRSPVLASPAAEVLRVDVYWITRTKKSSSSSICLVARPFGRPVPFCFRSFLAAKWETWAPATAFSGHIRMDTCGTNIQTAANRKAISFSDNTSGVDSFENGEQSSGRWRDRSSAVTSLNWKEEHLAECRFRRDDFSGWYQIVKIASLSIWLLCQSPQFKSNTSEVVKKTPQKNLTITFFLLVSICSSVFNLKWFALSTFHQFVINSIHRFLLGRLRLAQGNST